MLYRDGASAPAGGVTPVFESLASIRNFAKFLNHLQPFRQPHPNTPATVLIEGVKHALIRQNATARENERKSRRACRNVIPKAPQPQQVKTIYTSLGVSVKKTLLIPPPPR
jgi:hypothetical protein